MVERKKTSYGLKVPQQYARRRFIYSHSKRYPGSEYLSTQRKKREVCLPSHQLKGSDQGIEKTMLVLRSDSPLTYRA